MNEVFLAAYARVITRLHGMETVLIPCPADLRRFGNFAHVLTVANMTGLYRVAVEVRKEHRFTDTLQQLHLEMLTQKKEDAASPAFPCCRGWEAGFRRPF